MHKLKSKYIKLSPEQRLYNALYPIIGLTGGIASGKSTTSDKLKKMGIPLIDADQLVKIIYSEQRTLNFIAQQAPHCINSNENQINFPKLREVFFNNPLIKTKIEEHIYERLPEVFLQEVEKLDFSRYQFIVYDVPLLFEKDIQAYFDLIILVYTDRISQTRRLISRDNIDLELANSILDQQMSLDSKRTISHFILDNQSEIHNLDTQIGHLLNELVEVAQ